MGVRAGDPRACRMHLCMGTEDDFMFRSPTRRTAVVLQNTRILSSMLHSAATSTPSSEAQPAVSAGPGVAAAVPCVPTGAAGRLPDRGTLWISATCCCCCSSSGCESSSTVSWMKPEISLSCFRLLASTHGSRWVLKTSSRRPGHCEGLHRVASTPFKDLERLTVKWCFLWKSGPVALVLVEWTWNRPPVPFHLSSAVFTTSDSQCE
mmetsp:Transcript_10793/g.30615  ORF Transcript_10793/g.30615 Transcript_10793/m.30615 type:complete len:207 (-) Transcript_10793:330-950(-)